MRKQNYKLFSSSLMTFIALIVFNSFGYAMGEAKTIKISSPARSSTGFTGSGVPPFSVMLADYNSAGVRKADGRTDIPKLINALKKINAKDFMHLVWKENKYPNAWNDFPLMAEEFQKANINLWLYITPPSEGVPDPFGGDYVQWAIKCAEIANKYPVVKGIIIDDFSINVSTFTPEYCKKIMTSAHAIAPKLSLLVVSYFDSKNMIAKHVEQGVIDGVIFPYFSRPINHHDTSQLAGQINNYRIFLDTITTKNNSGKTMPLVVMVYASKLASSPDSPTSEYVKECLEIALLATKNGLASGVVTYGLPKSRLDFMQAVGSTYNGWNNNAR